MRGMQTYIAVRRMAEQGWNAEEISKKIGIPKHVVGRYLRHKPGKPATIPPNTQIKLPNSKKSVDRS